jgi:hypothetical protein
MGPTASSPSEPPVILHGGGGDGGHGLERTTVEVVFIIGEDLQAGGAVQRRGNQSPLDELEENIGKAGSNAYVQSLPISPIPPSPSQLGNFMVHEASNSMQWSSRSMQT